MNKAKPVICILLAGILWGCISIFMKGLTDSGISSIGIVSVRMFFAAVIYMIFMLIKSPSKLKIELKDIWMFILTGVVSVALFNIFYSYTIVNSEASIGVVLLYTSPIFTIILSAIFFREKLTPKKIIALVLVFAGCLMVSGILGGAHAIGINILLTGLGSGLFWATYTIFSRFPLKKYSSETCSVWAVIFAGIAMLPFGIAEGIPARIAADPVIILWAVGIAVVSTVAPYALYTYGLQFIEGGRAAIMVTIELVTGSLVGMIIFKEPHDAIKIVGIILCVFAIVFLNLHIPKHKKV